MDYLVQDGCKIVNNKHSWFFSKFEFSQYLAKNQINNFQNNTMITDYFNSNKIQQLPTKINKIYCLNYLNQLIKDK